MVAYFVDARRSYLRLGADLSPRPDYEYGESSLLRNVGTYLPIELQDVATQNNMPFIDTAVIGCLSLLTVTLRFAAYHA
jgi:hypothetical protein